MKIQRGDLARARGLRATDPMTVKDIDHLLGTLRQVQSHRRDVLGRLATRLPREGDRITPEVARAMQETRASMTFVTQGVTSAQALSDPEVVALVNEPGLAEVDRLIARLERRREQEVLRLSLTWPRDFRYTGKRFKCNLGGRFLEPGDVVPLNESQAAGWADLFEDATTPTVAESVSS